MTRLARGGLMTLLAGLVIAELLALTALGAWAMLVGPVVSWWRRR